MHLDRKMKLGKQNQIAEIDRIVRITQAATRKLGFLLKYPRIAINLKKKVFSMCVLPVMTYGMETISITINSANKLRNTQRAIERLLLEQHLEIALIMWTSESDRR